MGPLPGWASNALAILLFAIAGAWAIELRTDIKDMRDTIAKRGELQASMLIDMKYFREDMLGLKNETIAMQKDIHDLQMKWEGRIRRP